ncbi:prolyl endopeptidase isoform X2 [Bombyx mandarina]|uniref:Prolyl endopeptidase n=1 Tax=Bombyx mandarina TaxID=7092 RepID=A0A6J2JTM3_BOMMA|nr:prolyl endopeptidase isoform X2 [Bombyx mandarina]
MSNCMLVRCFFANHCPFFKKFIKNTPSIHHNLHTIKRPVYVLGDSTINRIVTCTGTTILSSRNMPYDYPAVRRDETVVDDYHGTKIKDPYRWLEDPDSNETKEFVEAQNKITRPYLDACPVQKSINERLTELWNYPKYSCPFRKGSRYFFFKNTGLQNQNALYVQDGLDGEPRVFLDPNTLSEDGTVALSGTKFTEDGSTLAYGLSASGSDWIAIHFKDVATGEDYPEVLEKVKFASMSWTKDNKGLFYSMYPKQTGKTDGSETEVNHDQKLCYHRINTSQSEDVVVVEFPEEPLWRIVADVSDCGRYLLVYPVRDSRDNLLFFADLSKHPEINGKLPLMPVVEEFEADYEYVTNEDSVCIIRTNKNAPNYRLIMIDLQNPAKENWRTLVPEHPTDVLDWAAAVDQDKLVIHYIRDVKSVLQLHDLKTGEFIQTFPLDVGSVVGFTGKKNQTEIFYHFMSFLTPGVIYHVDFKQKPYTPKVFREVTVKGFDASQYEAKQIFYSSKDGTKVPMFIISKKDLPRDGSNPVLLYGYGGFNINVQPGFSVTRLVFMQHMNGIVAIPNIRGGGEYGERWHNAGRLLNKQNVFDDFQAAAEYLVSERYTRPALLTIQGGSNGGLLVAACINQRPDLYGAAVVQSS